MEERVKSMLKIIEQDGDSFAKKAEMYFKKRPELVNFVEETYKAYRALAERYDHISGELHKANHTIATAFPDQVQFDTQDEDDDNLPEAMTSIDPSKFHKPTNDIPPNISLANKRKENQPTLKKSRVARADSQVSKEKAQEEVDRLQKGILVLQTEKEFIKSSYEEGMAKYRDIEKRINEMEERLLLQDGLSASEVIDDNEARTIMAVTALKYCEHTLNNVQEQQKRSIEEARIESERIKIAKEKIVSCKGEDAHSKKTSDIPNGNKEMGTADVNTEGEVSSQMQENLEPQSLYVEVQENIEISSDTSVVELAEKINELVSKVISLEVTASSQTAQIKAMTMESEALLKNLQGFEAEKKALIDDSNSLRERLKKAEELLSTRNLEGCLPNEKSLVDDFSAELSTNTGDISEKVMSPKLHDEVAMPGSSQEPETSLPNIEAAIVCDERGTEEKETLGLDSVSQILKQEDEISSSRADDTDHPSKKDGTQVAEQEVSLDWLQSLVDGIEGKEKIILAEYTSILRNYKEAKKRLSEAEKKNQEYLNETTERIKELESANVKKDEEIQLLQQNLRSLQSKIDENAYACLWKVEEGSIFRRHETSEGLNKAKSIKVSSEAASSKQLDYNGQPTTSVVEEKFRRDIDKLLEENLEFWLRFSTSFQNIQKLQTDFEYLQAEIEKVKKNKSEDGNSPSSGYTTDPESLHVERQLRELKTEMQVWLEHSRLLQGELQTRFSSVDSVQEEISGALELSLQEDRLQFAPYQAAKFQGELLNIQMENNKVSDELQAGLDHVSRLQTEVETTMLSKLHEKFELPESTRSPHHHHHFKYLPAKTRIPLRSFLFTGKPKKRQSIFAWVHPAMHKKNASDLAARRHL
ncbi:protein NETWORKED 2A-like [Iris pallida]|uniref:Protein NETWORKED 2A-like n=1 Tax=Iris pallida TaxID=29817 RepID=A0AAX6HQD7_IRIPA|nr:protein NETWORKED 2A-like [Iris pallida]